MNFIDQSRFGSIKRAQLEESIANNGGVSRDEFEKLTKAMADLSLFVREGFQQTEERKLQVDDVGGDHRDPKHRRRRQRDWLLSSSSEVDLDYLPL